MTDPLILTKVARKAIRRTGLFSFGFIATNKYKHCRTIKAYSTDTGGFLQGAVDAALTAAGSENHTFKRVKPDPRWYRGSHSFIVRIPN